MPSRRREVLRQLPQRQPMDQDSGIASAAVGEVGQEPGHDAFPIAGVAHGRDTITIVMTVVRARSQLAYTST